MNNQDTRTNNQIPITKQKQQFGDWLLGIARCFAARSRQRRRICLYLVFWLLVISCLLLGTGCVTIYNPATQKKEIYFIDENSEVAIGQNMARSILKKNKMVTDPKLISYLNEVGKKIAKVSDRNTLPYKFYLLADKEINAFALPGGYIFVNKGLIEETNQAELAFVLGHEIGHVSARHSVKRLQSSLGLSLLLGVALSDPDYEEVRRALDVIYNVVVLGYSREDELLADSLGLKYMIKADYEPEAALSLLEKLKEKDKDISLVFLRSHPKPQVRIQNIEDKLKATQKNHSLSP